MTEDAQDPVNYLQQHLAEPGLKFRAAQPSLEDVFVAVTLDEAAV
jgi:hypothetical protein